MLAHDLPRIRIFRRWRLRLQLAIEQRLVDPLRQPRPGEDEARVDLNQIGARFERVEGVGRRGDADAGDDRRRRADG